MFLVIFGCSTLLNTNLKRIVANRNYGIGYGDRSQSPAILECISLYLGYGIGQVYGC